MLFLSMTPLKKDRKKVGYIKNYILFKEVKQIVVKVFDID